MDVENISSVLYLFILFVADYSYDCGLVTEDFIMLS